MTGLNLSVTPTPASTKTSLGNDGTSGLSKALSRYSAYGWRGRIGVIAPSTNTTLEPEFWRMAPDGVSIHVARVHQSGVQGDQASYRRMADGIEHAAMLLGTAEVDVIAFGCTSCAYYVPPEEIRAAIESAGPPAILPADAVVEALRALGVRKVAVAGPRTDEVTQREIRFLQEAGVEVVAARCLGLGRTEEERRYIGRVPVEAAMRLAISADHAHAEAVFVSCTQLATLPMIATLEAELGKPVVTSNQAAFWRCLRMLGYAAPVKGFGMLLDAVDCCSAIASFERNSP